MRISLQDAIAKGLIKPDDIGALANSTRKKSSGGKREAEGEEQAVLIQAFRCKYPQYEKLLIHIPNGGSRKNAYEGWRLKQQGVRAGVSDLMLPVAREPFHGLWIEFKAAPPNDAEPTADQLEWLQLMREQGYQAHLCLGVAEAMQKISEYLDV